MARPRSTRPRRPSSCLLSSGGPPTITVITIGLDPSGDSSQLASPCRRPSSAAVRRAPAASARAPTIERVTIYGTGATTRWCRSRPRIVAFFLYFFVYLLTGVSFLRERTGGTLERLMATPVTRGEVVAATPGLRAVRDGPGRGPADLGAGLGPRPVDRAAAGVLARARDPGRRQPAFAFLVVVLLGLGAISLGIFLSTFARTELQVIQFIPLVLVPQFLLSGVLFPVSSLPASSSRWSRSCRSTTRSRRCDSCSSRAPTSRSGAPGRPAVLAVIAALFAVIASLTIRRDVV